MTKGPVSRCSECGAVVNVYWPFCLVCHAVLVYRQSELNNQTDALHTLSAQNKVIVEPAVKPDGAPLRPAYWERQGRIVGPGQPEFFFRDNFGQVGLIISYEGDLVSVADSVLRSEKAFIEQRPLTEVELIREGHR